MTPLQARVLAAWESLHPDFQVVPDPNHIPSRFAPWRYLAVHRATQVTVGSVTRYTQEMSDPKYEHLVTRLRNSLKYGHLPKPPKPPQPRDLATGQLKPRARQCPPPITVPPGLGYPLPYPSEISNIVLTGKAALLWKYGPRLHSSARFHNH